MNESSGEVAGCWYCRWTVQLRLKIQKFDVVAEVRNGGGLGITVLAIGAAEAGASSRWLDKLEPLKFLDLEPVSLQCLMAVLQVTYTPLLSVFEPANLSI